MMMSTWRTLLILALAVFPLAHAQAVDYADTVATFRKAGQSGQLFGNAFGYAVFPTIGKGGMVVGAAHGKGSVYQGETHVGDTSMTQMSIGAQLGGQAFSQVIFFQDRRAFETFTSGKFKFGAQASAVAITAGASAQATTSGTGAGASGTPSHATSAGACQNGMAVFTVAKGGLMYEASVGGQQFTYQAKRQ